MMLFLKHRLVLNALLSQPSDGSKYVWPLGLSKVTTAELATQFLSLREILLAKTPNEGWFVLTEALVQINVFSVTLIFMLLGKKNDKAHHKGNEAGSLHSMVKTTRPRHLCTECEHCVSE